MKREDFEEAQKVIAEIDQLKKEIAEIQKELASLAKNIDEKLLAEYKALRDTGIFPIVYKQNGSHCGYCNMELSMAHVSELNEKKYIVCETCHKITVCQE